MSRKTFRKCIGLILAIFFLITPDVKLHAENIKTVEIVVDQTEKTALTGATDVGANIEMSMTSDEMWSADGKWMAETFLGAKLNMMRWGYDAWAFDWEQEIPLSGNRYWGGLNSKDSEGTFGLREFIDFCKTNDIIPFVMIPIESLEQFGGEASLEKVEQLTTSMVQYIASQGIEQCYFDMGNEPWNNGADSIASASYLGELFPTFETIIKTENSNYKIVLQRAPQNILWNRWNNTLISAANNHFDAYDDHRYSFYGWNKYFDYNSDNILNAGSKIEGKEAILGECNIGWTPVDNNWDEGHTYDLGGGMALLNAMLNMIDSGAYSYIVSWPSHYPGKEAISGCPNNSFGWFDLNEWYLDNRTVRLTGPILAHRIINESVLENKVLSTSSDAKVRTFAYENNDDTQLNVIVINKWDKASLTIRVPEQFNSVSAMVMSGNGVGDRTPDYHQLFNENSVVLNGKFTVDIPAESVTVYTFSVDEGKQINEAPVMITPTMGETGVSTAKNFMWTETANAKNYHLCVSQNSDFSNPEIDVYTGIQTSYQMSESLQNDTHYFWNISSQNVNGATTISSGEFTTIENANQGTIILNNDSIFITHSSNWNIQSSGGSYRNDDMSCEKKDGYAEFVFTGTQAKIFGIKGNWCGLASVQVDNGEIIIIDTYQDDTQEQALIYDTGQLQYGEHIVTLTVRGEKNSKSSGSWIEYDKVEIRDDVTGTATVDKVIWNDENSNIKKSMFWTHQSVPGSYHDDDSSSATRGASMEYSFNGTELQIYGLKASWCGKADISVDGSYVVTVDTYSENTQYQALFFDTEKLPEGQHTVKITVNGSKNTSSSGKWIEIDKVIWK